jgi:hypothetical protein
VAAVTRALVILALAITIISLAYFHGNARNAVACSCSGNITIGELREGADAIFVGRVLAVIPTSLITESAVFSVNSSWKGVNERVVSTASSGTACGAEFEIGHEYLIYASEYNGGLNTGRCGGTQSLSYAADDVQILGNANMAIIYPMKVDILSAPLIGLGAAIAGVIAFITLRRKKI